MWFFPKVWHVDETLLGLPTHSGPWIPQTSPRMHLCSLNNHQVCVKRISNNPLREKLCQSVWKIPQFQGSSWCLEIPGIYATEGATRAHWSKCLPSIFCSKHSKVRNIDQLIFVRNISFIGKGQSTIISAHLQHFIPKHDLEWAQFTNEIFNSWNLSHWSSGILCLCTTRTAQLMMLLQLKYSPRSRMHLTQPFAIFCR